MAKRKIRKIIPILTSVILIVALLAGLFLVQKNQNIENKAANYNCSSNSRKCVGNVAYSCNSRGIWTYVKTCPSSQMCSSGVCIPKLVCTPEDRKCVGNVAYRCYAPGTRWTTTTCNKYQICSNGICKQKQK